MRLLYDYYVIHIPCLSLRYPFGIPSEWYRGGIGMITDMIGRKYEL